MKNGKKEMKNEKWMNGKEREKKVKKVDLLNKEVWLVPFLQLVFLMHEVL